MFSASSWGKKYEKLILMFYFCSVVPILACGCDKAIISLFTEKDSEVRRLLLILHFNKKEELKSAVLL